MNHDITYSPNRDETGECTHYTLKDNRAGGKIIGTAVKTDTGGFKFHPSTGTGLTTKSAKTMLKLKIAIRKEL